MRKLKYISVCMIVCIVATSLLLIGYKGRKKDVDANKIIESSDQIASKKYKNNKSRDNFVLTVWSNSFDQNHIINCFGELYPKAQVNVVNFNGNYSDKVIQAIGAGKAPDVIIYTTDELGKFNSTDAFEDLSQSKYNKDINAIFNKENLEQYKSLGGEKLIALPCVADPMVTYYRTDILEQHGITTDPDKLGDLMEKPERWLTIAKKLKKDNISAVQWDSELISIALNAYGYFDKNINLKFNNKIKETVALTREIHRLGLEGNNDIWATGGGGQKSLKDGKIAMLYLNKWGENNLQQMVPETIGKWRVTRLPLGMYGCSGSKILSITSSSKYKMQAWNLVKQIIKDDKNYFNSIRDEKSVFLGGQKSNLLYEKLSNKVPLRYLTLLDDKSYSIFAENMMKNLNNYADADEAIDSIKSKVTNSIANEQKILAEYVREIRKK